jgi:hypothetical protein
MRFPEQRHHGARLSDSSADAQRDFALDDSLVTREFQEVRLARHFPLLLARGSIRTASNAGTARKWRDWLLTSTRSSRENRPYLLIGLDHWGSNGPWLGIPLEWDEISGARVIVEAGFRDIRVRPSQGNHFFQNLTAFQVDISRSIQISARVPWIGSGCRRNLAWKCAAACGICASAIHCSC